MSVRKRYGVPEATTQGNVGDLYVDLDTGKVYRCEDIVTYGDEHSYGTVYTNRGNKNTVYVWKSTGASSYNELEDKPFYEETVTVKEPLNITWDGNTEGLVQVPDMPIYKVSDIVFTDEEIKLMSMTVNGAPSATFIGDVWDEQVGKGIIATDDVTTCMMIAFVRKAGAIFSASGGTITFPEAGVYFMIIDETYVTSLTTTEPVEQTKTVVKKLDPKFLPDNVGGGIKYVTIGEEYDENDNVTYTASATYDEIAGWIKSGMDVKCVYGPCVLNLIYSSAISDISTFGTAALSHRFAVLDLESSSRPIVASVFIYDDGDVYINKWLLTTVEN